MLLCYFASCVDSCVLTRRTKEPQPPAKGFTSQLQHSTTNGNLLAFACGFLRDKTSVWMRKLNNFSIEHQPDLYRAVRSGDRVLFVPGSLVKKGDWRLTISCDCQTESSLDSHIVIVMIILLTSTSTTNHQYNSQTFSWFLSTF